MTPFFLLAALASGPVPIAPADPWNAGPSPLCETIEDLNPTGPLYDMLDWLTLDRDLRETSHLASEPGIWTGGKYGGPYVMGTVLTFDRLVYLKTMEGDTWDVNLIDDLGIWGWRTESAWGAADSPTQFRSIHAILLAPRKARGGYPGMRWVNCDSAYATHTACGDPTGYGHLGYVVHELYGPYDYEPGWGDVRGPILKLVYFYGCTTPETASCGAAEVSWLSQRFGSFAWRFYERVGTEWVLRQAPPIDAYVVPGAITPYEPCDARQP